MVILETDRLILRRLHRSDLDVLYEMYGDPETRRYFPDGVRTREETAEELEWFLSGHPQRPELGLWACVAKDTGEVVGRSGLLPWTIGGKAEVEVAYMISKTHWRRGLGSEVATGLIGHGFHALGL